MGKGGHRMPVEMNYLEYHKSLANELCATKNRVRNLIGDRHWLTDGEHKEAIVRKLLSAHLPESFNVGRGFVCYPDSTSNQIDIMIISKNKPTLFKDESLFIVTPDAIQAIIEIKTSQTPFQLKASLDKLSNNVEKIRRYGNRHCCAGLFIYDDNQGIEDVRVLRSLFKSANTQEERAINWVAFGPKWFFRFWNNGEDIQSRCTGPVWHSYELEDGLAYAYFLSNAMWDTSYYVYHTTGRMSLLDSQTTTLQETLNRQTSHTDMQFAWFPIEGGKEQFRKHCISLDNSEPISF
jgi:hypothetical protein